jgi:ABC-type transport system substrate-binding protein
MRRKALAFVLFFGLLAAACGGDGSSDSPGGAASQQPAAQPDLNAEVRAAYGEDTWQSEGGPAGIKSRFFAYPLNLNVYEPLIYLGSDFSLKPGLAERWELVNDNKTWRFHLRKGVKFHDGSAFDAEDVMWSWATRQIQGQPTSAVVATLKTADAIKKVDDFTVDFTPVVTNLRLPEQILHPGGGITKRGTHMSDELKNGTGPFQLVSYRPNQDVVVERFDGYWGEKAKVKKISVRFLPEPQTRVQALKAGEVDLVIDLPPEAVSGVKSDAKYKVVASKPGRNQLIYINRNSKAPWDLGGDKAVREAVSLALDRKGYVDTVFEGNADPGRTMANLEILGNYANNVAPVPYDAARAKTVLEAAGWKPGSDGIRSKDGRRLELTIIGWPEVTDTGYQFLQSQLKAVGIDLKIKKANDRSTYDGFYRNTEFDLDLEVPNQNDGNPAFLPILRMYSKNEAAFRFAPGGEFDTWAEKALAATTRDEVQKASGEMQKILINQEFIVVPVAGVFRIFGMTKDMSLGDPHPSQTSQTWLSLSKTAAK